MGYINPALLDFTHTVEPGFIYSAHSEVYGIFHGFVPSNLSVSQPSRVPPIATSKRVHFYATVTSQTFSNDS